MLTTPKHKQHKQWGVGIIDIVLVLIILGLISATTLPSLKHSKKRFQYREISDISNQIIGTIEKCLGMERDPNACSSTEKIVPYGYLYSLVTANSLIDSIDLSLNKNQYALNITPSLENSIYPFITDEHTLIRKAEVIDRNGRPIIEEWKTDPQSGCMLAGFCE